jgi:hypothetical protein
VGGSFPVGLIAGLAVLVVIFFVVSK